MPIPTCLMNLETAVTLQYGDHFNQVVFAMYMHTTKHNDRTEMAVIKHYQFLDSFSGANSSDISAASSLSDTPSWLLLGDFEGRGLLAPTSIC